jgi:hypothetical protein
MRSGAAPWRLLIVSVWLGTTATWSFAAHDPDASVGSYLAARDERVTGEVSGHVSGDPARPSAAPVPYDGVSVMLLPYSSGLEGELDAVKRHFRGSLQNYMGAVETVSDARGAYEKVLLAAGGGELIRGEVTDARGLVRFVQVPAGEWLLLAWRTELHPVKTPKLRKEDTSAFRDVAVRTGYSTVSYWRMRLLVRAGETAEVDLNDRNVWLTGVREDVHLSEGASHTTPGSRKRR